MEQNIVIYIGIYKTFGLITTLLAGTWYLSHRLTRVETTVEGLDRRLTNVETRMANLEGRMDRSFGGASPLSLLPKGEVILQESGLKRYVDERKDALVEACRAHGGMTTPYDTQAAAFAMFDEMDFDEATEAAIKGAAFQQGVSIETVRRVGGIYFRDICLAELGRG